MARHIVQDRLFGGGGGTVRLLVFFARGHIYLQGDFPTQAEVFPFVGFPSGDFELCVCLCCVCVV
jgi:hypothetical protein